MVCFDHIEVHVKNATNYVEFLKRLFGNGRYKKISDNNTYMFVSGDQIHLEVKENEKFSSVYELSNGIGFCLPCLRMKGAKNHLSNIPEITFIKEIQNPDGICIFFKDHENIDWHFKDYDCQDIYINI
jgi:hypothetical protein